MNTKFINGIKFFNIIRFEYIESTGDNTGSCINNTCNGLIGMLIRKVLYIHTYYFTRLTLFNETVDFLFKIKEISLLNNITLQYHKQNFYFQYYLNHEHFQRMSKLTIIYMPTCSYVLKNSFV